MLKKLNQGSSWSGDQLRQPIAATTNCGNQLRQRPLRQSITATTNRGDRAIGGRLTANFYMV